jgi:hypothetical protein
VETKEAVGRIEKCQKAILQEVDSLHEVLCEVALHCAMGGASSSVMDVIFASEAVALIRASKAFVSLIEEQVQDIRRSEDIASAGMDTLRKIREAVN